MSEINIEELISKPIFFGRNRVFRVYKGGKQYSSLCGDEPVDNMFPEEWIASKVKAVNPKYFGERDGVSIIEGTKIFFDDLLNKYSKQLLGSRKYDCLVKYLDSAIRLPMQVHPDKAFSKKYFNSEYGKTEAWLVIDTRPDAKIYFGFKDKINKDKLSKYEERSLVEKDIMAGIMNEVKANIGDIYLIKAGLIHAIGAGCTIVEVQEPTDFTIQPENWCGDYQISEQEKYIGLTKEIALDCFDYNLYGKKAVDCARIIPKTVIDEKGYKKEILISYEDTPCFAQNRHTIDNGSFVMNYGPSVWIVLDGEATIFGKEYSRNIKKGEYFFLPYISQGKFSVSGKATLIECLPSKQDL